MTEQHALSVNNGSPASSPISTPSQREVRSGVHAKARRDGSGGWGLVVVDLAGPPRTVSLADGAVIGISSADAAVEGPGIAAEHCRVSVRSDGCYFEDLGSPEGTFVGGVRAKRISVMHGDVVRLGRQVAVFVERDLASYSGAIGRTSTLVHGPKQRADWIDPVLELAKNGSSVCIEGPPGHGKRTLARLAGAMREAAGEIAVVEAGADGKVSVPSGVRPATWVVLNADRLARPQQLEIAHAVGRATGVSIIATVNQPLDRAAADGHVAPWFSAMFSGRRIAVPSLESRREDIPLILGEIAKRRQIPVERFSADLVEALMRAAWPGGVPQLEASVAQVVEATPSGALQVGTIAATLARPSKTKATLPPSADPALARARLEDALARANGSVASAARSLGMSRQAIYREADRLGLDVARRKTPR